MAIMGRNALFGTAVMAALGVPFALSDKDPAADKQPADLPAVEVAEGSSGDIAAWEGKPSLLPTDRAVEGAPVTDLSEILRFDVTPSWLIQRWPRVMNSRHAAGDLHAYRVPLVTGAKAQDLAGSLTYYFDESQRLKRIQLQANTGDPMPLADFLSRQFGFARRMTGDPGQTLYDVRRDGAAVGQLIIRNSPVIDAAMPQTRFRIELFIDRPSEHRMFSDAAGHRFESHRWP